MTVIAYRNGVMCCDTMCRYRDFVTYNNNKILYNDKFVIGVAGLATYMEKVKLFLEKQYDKIDDIPEIKEDSSGNSEATFLVYDRVKNRLTYHTSSGMEDVSHINFFATGAGAEMAIAAMEFGASAEEAVDVCIKRSPYCGGDCVTVFV